MSAQPAEPGPVTPEPAPAPAQRPAQRSPLPGIFALLGVAFLIGGAIFGFIPVHVRDVNCGTGFVQSEDLYIAQLSDAMRADAERGYFTYDPNGLQDLCDSARSTMRVPAIGLLVIGTAFAITGGITAGKRRD